MSPYLVANKQVAAAIAFSLALFSHVLNHVMMRLQAALYELENPPKILTTDNSSGSCQQCFKNCNSFLSFIDWWSDVIYFFSQNCRITSAVTIRYLQIQFDTAHNIAIFDSLRYKINNGDSLSVGTPRHIIHTYSCSFT